MLAPMAEMDEFLKKVGSTFVWHEVYAASAQKSADFYTEALGWGIQEMDMGPGGKYKMLTVDGIAVAGIQGTAETPGMENIPAHWSVYTTVDDVDARLAKCTLLGGTVVVPPMDIPTVGRMALIKDPQGATFWLFKPSPKA